MIRVAAICIAILASAAAAEAQVGVKVVTDPTWLYKPDQATIDRRFPDAARVAQVSGVASMQCAVNSDGWLENCVVASEEPEGLGFGQAALQLSTFFRMNSRTSDGASVEGSIVRVPITMQLPKATNAVRAPLPPPGQFRGPRVSIITNPTLLSTPDAAAFSRVYPMAAQRAGIEGRALIHCRVTIDGKLSECVVIEETPMGAGFGVAAVGLASAFVVTPKTYDGKPVDGDVRIPIVFKMPSGQ
jgi:TonB family protein